MAMEWLQNDSTSSLYLTSLINPYSALNCLTFDDSIGNSPFGLLCLKWLVRGAVTVCCVVGVFGGASNVICPDGLVVSPAQLLTVLVKGLPPSQHPPEAIVKV